MSRSAGGAQRCAECDGVQPLRSRECEICGAPLDGSLRLEAMPKPKAPERRRHAATKAAAKPAARPKTRTWPSVAGWGRSLWKASLRGLRLVVGWTLLAAAVMSACALGLTFATQEGTLGAGIAAAWQYLRQPLLVAAAIAWGAGLGYDLVQVPVGKPSWSARLSFREVMLGVAAPAVLLIAAAQEGAVPPTAWQWAPFASLAGFVVTLALKLFESRVANRSAVKLVALGGVVATLGIAWLAAPRSDVPAGADQLGLDRRLRAAIPLPHCSPRPIEALPPGLLRNSLAGLVHCHRGRLQGTFMAFHNSELMDVYVSYRRHLVDGREERHASRCSRRAGAYSSSWFKEARPNRNIGALLCFGKGRRNAVLEWEDPRSDVFASIRGRTRPGLYRWWHQHQVRPGFRG